MKMIRKKLADIAEYMGNSSLKLSMKIKSEKPKLHAEVTRWIADKGDTTLRLNYPLNPDSVVFDLGGYEGWFAARIFGKYLSKVYVFEPYAKYCEDIRDRFLHNPNIFVFPFGLAEQNSTASLAISDEGSSMFKEAKETVNIQLVRAADFFAEKKISFIDLMKINIEGGEYGLLEHLIETGFISKIKDVQIQFHDFVPGAEERMKNIQTQLRKTHKLTYEYKFIWENWTLNA
jgi:FkbM family methyltransferase